MKDYVQHRNLYIPCDCKKTFVLSIEDHIAQSNYFEPGIVYEYSDFKTIDLTEGFSFWLYENTKNIHYTTLDFDVFVTSVLRRGRTFYDGCFMKNIGKILTEHFLANEIEESFFSENELKDMIEDDKPSKFSVGLTQKINNLFVDDIDIDPKYIEFFFRKNLIQLLLMCSKINQNSILVNKISL